ncbi:MAG: FkbM family methyltransferase [Planctomycetes bacterium]|nr:FkbM family methyltransferase [Planctomycetota bacterium]
MDMQVLLRNAAQAWDRLCRLGARLSGHRVPDCTGREVQPVVVIGSGRDDAAPLVRALAPAVSFVPLETGLGRLVKRLRRPRHRRWPYLARLTGELAGAAGMARQEQLLALPPDRHSLAALVRALAGGDGAWGLVAHDAGWVEPLRELFAGARWVHLHRDGVDAALAESGNAPARLADAARRWQERTIGALELARVSPESVLRLRYEDALADPAAALATLERFLGLPPGRADAAPLAATAAAGPDAPGTPGYGRGRIARADAASLGPLFERELGRLGYPEAAPEPERFFSQTGQDRFLAEQVFAGRDGGFFVDVGAHDGVTYSNSRYFENRGWRGVCVEPNPEVFARLRANRACECVNACISGRGGTVAFLMVRSGRPDDLTNMLGGMESGYDPRHRRRLEEEARRAGATVERIEVPSRCLHEVVPPGQAVDFVSIDVEGVEMEVLQAIDFQRLSVRCFVIENNFGNPRIGHFLAARGYRQAARLGVDEVYLRD